MPDHDAQRSVTKIKLGGATRTHKSIQVERTLEETWLYAPESTAVHEDTGELYTHHSSAWYSVLDRSHTGLSQPHGIDGL